MKQTQKNSANDNCGGTSNSPAIAGKEVKRMNSSKLNSRPCLVDHRPWSQKSDGFTLMELLVVIAIITLLVALGFTLYQPPREEFNQIKCDSNLKNLFLALQMYADDNDGRCPIPDVTGQTQVSKQIQVSMQFMEALQPYLKSEEIFRCPVDTEIEAHKGGSYGWRVTRDPKTSLAGVRLALIRHPDRVMIAGELSHGCHKPDMINALYADGHVNLVTIEEFLKNIRTPLEF